MKGGEGYVVAAPGRLVRNPDFVVDGLPASEEELLLRLAAAGIDPEKCVPTLEAGPGWSEPGV